VAAGKRLCHNAARGHPPGLTDTTAYSSAPGAVEVAAFSTQTLTANDQALSQLGYRNASS